MEGGWYPPFGVSLIQHIPATVQLHSPSPGHTTGGGERASNSQLAACIQCELPIVLQAASRLHRMKGNKDQFITRTEDVQH